MLLISESKSANASFLKKIKQQKAKYVTKRIQVCFEPTSRPRPQTVRHFQFSKHRHVKAVAYAFIENILWHIK